RVVARLDIHALLDGRMALADLDGDGVPEAVILSDPAPRASQGGGTETGLATSVAVIGLRPNGLDLRGRLSLPAPAVFENLVPMVAPLLVGPRSAAAFLVRSTPEQGAAIVVLGWRDDRPTLLAEGPGLGPGRRSVRPIGVADVTGDGAPEILAIAA